MFGLGLTELAILLLVIILGWAGWRVAGKAGFSPAWGLLVVVPVVNLIVLWVFAFIQWPALSSPGSPEKGGA